MIEFGGCRALEFRDDALGQDLPQFDSPLVEWIEIPDRALSENGMLVKSHQLAQDFRGESLCQDSV